MREANLRLIAYVVARIVPAPYEGKYLGLPVTIPDKLRFRTNLPDRRESVVTEKVMN